MGASMQVSLRRLVFLVLVIGCGCATVARAQAAQGSSGAVMEAKAGVLSAPAADNPVADPKAIVTVGNARFTVLTPQLIRMEWSADGKFEDHASFVFINRRLPVPKFEKTISTDGRDTLTIKTDSLALEYTAMPGGKPLSSGCCGFTTENLSVTLTVDGKQVVWHPGDTNPENLMGTTRRGARRPRNRSTRGWCRERDGRWLTIRRDRCSTRRISDSLRARRARGRG